MADLLTIGTSGLKAYSRALSTTSDNIANAQTVGYARRSVRTADSSAISSQLEFNSKVQANGVTVISVERAVDDFLIIDARAAGSESGRTGVRLAWAEAVERAVDDGSSGVGQNITRVYNAADILSSDPGNTTKRASFLQAVTDTADAFRTTAGRLESIATNITTDAQISADQLSTNLEALKRVNQGLQAAREGSTNKAALLDERDRLIDSVASAVGVTTTFDARGVATVRAAGPSGDLLADASTAADISVTAATDGTLSFAVSNGATSTLVPTTGRLAGLGRAASDLSAKRTELDGLATRFASDINTAHQAGIDANGNPGVALLSIGAGAASLVAISVTNDQVAAASSSSENGNALSFASLRSSTGTEATWNALIAQQAQSTASARAQDAAATSRQNGADEARSALSGVDLDREAADLLRYQQAYEGAARTIQVARETLQTILNLF